MVPAAERGIKSAAIADLQQRHLLFGIESVMLEYQSSRQIIGAAEHADTHRLALQIGDLFVLGLGD